MASRVPILNHTVAALRFFFRVTLRRSDIIEHTTFLHEPRKLPVVLSPEEVARLLDAAPGLKYKAALSVAYGAGLRAAEVISLKVGDIDSKRMVIRVEQGKGRKDRYVMLSPHLLELLRAWWKAARPQGWLFPGRDRVQPMTTRQLNRACHAAAQTAEIDKRVSLHTLRHSFATHLLEQNIDIRVIQVLLGHAKLDTTALYTRVATKTIQRGHEPAGAYCPLTSRRSSRPLKRGSRAASSAGGRGYLPRPRTGMAPGQCRPCQPRPTEGDVGDRELPHGSPRRPCRALRGLRPYHASPTTPAATGIARSARALPRSNGSPTREAELLPVPYYHVVFTLPAPIADIAYQNKAVIYDLLFKASAETMVTIAADPKHLGARIGITSVLHTWGSAMTHHPHVHMIVPGGGISLDGKSWIACRPGFFLPVRVLSRLFRRLFLEKLIAAHKAGQSEVLRRSDRISPIAQAFAAYLAPLRRTEWVVYAKRPFGGPEAVLAYLSRYTHRVAIANSRLIACDRTGVTFRWKDYRAEGRDRQQAHDARHRRVHPPLPHPRAAARLPPHPPLRTVRQRHPRRQHRPSA